MSSDSKSDMKWQFMICMHVYIYYLSMQPHMIRYLPFYTMIVLYTGFTVIFVQKTQNHMRFENVSARISFCRFCSVICHGLPRWKLCRLATTKRHLCNAQTECLVKFIRGWRIMKELSTNHPVVCLFVQKSGTKKNKNFRIYLENSVYHISRQLDCWF